MKLRDYQRQAIQAVRKEWDSGCENAMIVLATGLGKALRNDQKVLSATGWRPIGEMLVGDYVFGGSGMPTRVCGVYPQGVRPLVSVTVSSYDHDDVNVVCDLDHLWTVWVEDPLGGKGWEVRKTSNLTDRIAAGGAWRIPCLPAAGAGPFTFPEFATQPRWITKITPVDPAPATCIKVEAPDGLFVTEGYVVTHNTIIFTSLGRELRLEGARRILVLAHRRELVKQAYEKWRKVDPHENLGIYQGSRRDVHADVICASVQSCYPDVVEDIPCATCRVPSVAKDGSSEWAAGPGCGACDGVGSTQRLKRRGRIHELPLSEIDLVIVDEAHHITKDSLYHRVLEAIREVNPTCLHLGVTATPFRADNRGLGWLYPGIAFTMSIQAGIERQYLVPVRGVRVELDIDLSEVRVSKSSGDFVDEDLGEVMDTADARQEIVAAWLKHAGPGVDPDHPDGRLTAAFCPTVAAAEHLAETFREAGVDAEWLCGATPKDERAAILARYGAGTTRVIVNVGVLTEGWDEPATSCILIARPTKSKGLYVQILGRGTRLVGATMETSTAAGKHDCLVIDTTGATNLGLASLADLSGDDEPEKDEAEKEEDGDLEPEQPEIEFPEEPKTVRITGHSSYDIDLFGGRVHWAKVNGSRVANMGPRASIVVFGSGHAFSAIEVGMGNGVRWIARDQPEIDVLKAAEIHALQNGQEKFLQPGAWFTRRPSSDKQRAYLKRLARWSQALGPVPLTDQEVDCMSMAQASNWVAYLSARLEFAKAAKAGTVGEVAATGDDAAA